MRPASKLISHVHPSLHLSHPTPDSFAWNTLIRAAASSSSSSSSALSAYLRMRRHGVRPDTYTLPFLLLPFSSPAHLLPGRAAHAHALLLGLLSHPFTQTSLITMYSNCDHLDDACRLFDEIPHPDLPSWNSIICGSLKSGFLDAARSLFYNMPERNVVTWSCMINGLVKQGSHKEALTLFRDMQREASVQPNNFTLSSVLSACAGLGALEHGKWVHMYIERCSIVVDAVLGTSLIDMYSKCGSIERARRVFDDLGCGSDVMAWSTMMSALAIHGHAEECLMLFERMRAVGVVPNAVTFLAVLCACVHGGMVHEGKKYFKQMREEYSIDPKIQHYGCFVDLFARAGFMDEAWNVVNSMPMKPDVLIWGALLSGSRTHGDIETCESSLKQVIDLEPMNSGAYVLLSNIYAKIGRWDDVRHVRDLMEEKGIKKTPGCSLVEVGGHIHEFFVGDTSHPDTKEIYLMLEEIMERLKLAGYVRDTREVLLDLEEEGKELALSLHSEKLAIAFSFIKTRPGTTIHIVKNLRTCIDCHNAFKLITKIYDREIIVRDCTRFHHFRDGSCSCKDFW